MFKILLCLGLLLSDVFASENDGSEITKAIAQLENETIPKKILELAIFALKNNPSEIQKTSILVILVNNLDDRNSRAVTCLENFILENWKSPEEKLIAFDMLLEKVKRTETDPQVNAVNTLENIDITSGFIAKFMFKLNPSNDQRAKIFEALLEKFDNTTESAYFLSQVILENDPSPELKKYVLTALINGLNNNRNNDIDHIIDHILANQPSKEEKDIVFVKCLENLQAAQNNNAASIARIICKYFPDYAEMHLVLEIIIEKLNYKNISNPTIINIARLILKQNPSEQQIDKVLEILAGYLCKLTDFTDNFYRILDIVKKTDLSAKQKDIIFPAIMHCLEITTSDCREDMNNYLDIATTIERMNFSQEQKDLILTRLIQKLNYKEDYSDIKSLCCAARFVLENENSSDQHKRQALAFLGEHVNYPDLRNLVIMLNSNPPEEQRAKILDAIKAIFYSMKDAEIIDCGRLLLKHLRSRDEAKNVLDFMIDKMNRQPDDLIAIEMAESILAYKETSIAQKEKILDALIKRPNTNNGCNVTKIATFILKNSSSQKRIEEVLKYLMEELANQENNCIHIIAAVELILIYSTSQEQKNEILEVLVRYLKDDKKGFRVSTAKKLLLIDAISKEDQNALKYIFGEKRV